jgi:hypothetical protein
MITCPQKASKFAVSAQAHHFLLGSYLYSVR